MEIEEKHISLIKSGDTIICPDGRKRTVCDKDIKRCNFMGLMIFGDSWNLGTLPVKVVNPHKPKEG